MRAAGLAALLLLAGAVSAAAAEAPLPPSPDRHVTDKAGFLSASTVSTLDARLADYERTTGHQILVYIGDTTGDTPLDDWSNRTFAAWKVGRKGKDDGLVLFVLAKDHKMDIEVGYGLEGQVPDARAKQIIDDTMTPLLKAGKPDDAVTAGVNAILAAIEGQPVAGAAAPTTTTATPTDSLPGPQVGQRPAARAAPQLSLGRLILYGIIGLILLIGAITHPQMALFFLLNIFSGGRGFGGGGGGFGGGGGGGGWSGGGGSSGGGGARGSW
jgi:uncharacterized protein